MIEVLLVAIYAVSLATCWVAVWRCGEDVPLERYGRNIFDPGLAPGFAGFGVFPVINTLMAIGIVLWWISRDKALNS